MINQARFGDILSDLADELPLEFFDELNLGVRIDERAKPHPQSRGGDLFVLGEYQSSPMGSGIVIYYGSFARLFGDLDEEALVEEMRKTLRHEFRHHVEGRAGERGLEKEDEKFITDYLKGC